MEKHEENITGLEQYEQDMKIVKSVLRLLVKVLS
jgi:hypothetical protein